jgi:MerC mercury resistance protein
MSASIVCAVHCALLPLVLMTLPVLGFAWLDSAWVDWTMMAVAVSIAFKALRGEYAIDRRCLPASVALAGILAILTAIF